VTSLYPLRRCIDFFTPRVPGLSLFIRFFFVSAQAAGYISILFLCPPSFFSLCSILVSCKASRILRLRHQAFLFFLATFLYAFYLPSYPCPCLQAVLPFPLFFATPLFHQPLSALTLFALLRRCLCCFIYSLAPSPLVQTAPASLILS